jgi:hypothetical protein
MLLAFSVSDSTAKDGSLYTSPSPQFTGFPSNVRLRLSLSTSSPYARSGVGRAVNVFIRTNLRTRTQLYPVIPGGSRHFSRAERLPTLAIRCQVNLVYREATFRTAPGMPIRRQMACGMR